MVDEVLEVVFDIENIDHKEPDLDIVGNQGNLFPCLLHNRIGENVGLFAILGVEEVHHVHNQRIQNVHYLVGLVDVREDDMLELLVELLVVFHFWRGVYYVGGRVNVDFLHHHLQDLHLKLLLGWEGRFSLAHPVLNYAVVLVVGQDVCR